MFSRISRYRRLPDVVTTAPDGRAVASKSLRLLPEVAGRFLHTVQDVDRLDHVAFKYYDQPRDWWRVADANPSFLDPNALLGSDPFSTERLSIAFTGHSTPWSALVHALLALPGVRTAMLGGPDQPFATLSILEGNALFDIADTFLTDLEGSGRTQSLTAALDTELSGSGVVLSSELRISHPGPGAWQIIDADGPRAFTFVHFPATSVLTVHESEFRYDWELTVEHNRQVAPNADLPATVESLGFEAGPVSEMLRVGSSIVIPPRRA